MEQGNNNKAQQDGFEAELVKFDPQVAELKVLAESAKGLTITDFKDKAQIQVVHDKRMELKQIRVNITKTGKMLRDKANAFNKQVLDKEHEMVGVIQPEEERLEALEDEADRIAEVEGRRVSLPLRKERLAEIGDEIQISDQGILEMDDLKFEAYFNQRVANWNIEQKDRLEKERVAETERKEREAQEKAEADAKAEEDRKAKQEAEDKARQEKIAKEDADREAKKKVEDDAAAAKQAELAAAAKKLEDDRKELEHQKELEATRKEAEAKAKKEAEEKAAADAAAKAEAEKKAKEEADLKAKAEEERKQKEAEELRKREEYQKFLSDHGYTEKTKGEFHLEEDGAKVVLFKKVGTFNK